MKKALYFLVIILPAGIFSSPEAQTTPSFNISATFHIPGRCIFDDLSVGTNNRLYVSHESYVNVLDENTGASLGTIPNTPGVHGIAFASSFGKGYTSDGNSDRVTVFDLGSNKVLGEIPTGKGPDAILYDSFSRKIVSCNEGSHDLSLIDPETDRVVGTIPLTGSCEAAASDGKGKLYVNIKKGFIDVVNMQSNKVEKQVPIGTGKRPLGLALDSKTNRLFSATFNGWLMIIDPEKARIVDSLHIGYGCDGVVFDPTTNYIFTSNSDTTLTVIKEISPDSFKVFSTVRTRAQANTLAIDVPRHAIFISAPNGGSARDRGFSVLVVRYN
jgi:DNA-binding beta-propeller fold protein YncE